MADPSPWDGIATPGRDFNVRQVADDTAVPCFWGRDAAGACLFIIELEGDYSTPFRKDPVTVRGIGIDLRSEGSGHQRLVLALESEVDRDLFEGLCRTLLTALGHASDSASSFAVTLAHLRRWKAFLSGRGAQLLSPEEVQGLFAELIFFLELLDDGRDGAAVVEAWLGPERSHQDFIFGNTAVEVKSLSGTERSTVRISSEDQLESLNDNLFLRIYRLSAIAEAPGARSLNALVQTIEARLTAAEALEAFDRSLVTHRYAPLPDYDEPEFVVSEVSTYRVEDDFPRLMRSQLPQGIAKVTYDIRLEAIAPYECHASAVLGGG
jgi:hypothetical protein